LTGFAGENVSLSLDFDAAEGFQSAGYEPLTTNSSYQGGLTRQHGALSFSRIFQSGHGSSAYQPETLSRLFERTMFGRDVATGEVDLSESPDYATTGPASVQDVINEVPEPQSNVCIVQEAPNSCTKEQMAALADGSAIVENFRVVDPKGAPPAPIISTNQGALSNNDDDDDDSETPADPNQSNEPNAGRKLMSFGLGSLIVALLTASVLM
jgi:hypothetical protein